MVTVSNNINIHVYTGNGFLLPFKQKIEETSEKLLEKVLSLLSISDVDVEIYAGDLRHAPEAGIIGHTENLHHITIALMPQHQNFYQIVLNDLPKTIAHELHHIARWRALGTDKTFLESLISEGLAGKFEIEVIGGQPSLCFRSVTEEQIMQLLPLAEKEFTNKDYDHYAWFTGSEERHIPHWAGYGIGYFIVKKYLEKHQNDSPSILYKTKAELFI